MAKTREKLIDVARQLFARIGVENTTMNDIALASKKGRRTLYTYFNNKTEIYQAVIQSELAILYDSLETVAKKDLPADEKLLEFINVRLQSIKDVVFRNGTLKANFFRDIWRVENVRKDFDLKEIAYIQLILNEGVKDKIFDIDDTRSMAAVLHHAFKGLEVPYIRGIIRGIDPEEHTGADSIIKLLFFGIKATSPSLGGGWGRSLNIKRCSMKLLEGKTAVITGAARGIGKSVAIRFAQEGCNIAFTDLAIDDNAKATEAEIAALGVKVKGYASNAADFEETHTVITEIVKDFGRVDILVNNAGITRDGLMMRMSEQQWDMVININLKSAFNFIHALAPVMMRQKGGSIINMSSVVGVHGNAGQANYSASKAGMIGLAKSIARELGSRGIRANAIAPGFIVTEMTHQLSDDVREEWAKQIPLRRPGTPDDVANAAIFLASDLSAYITGQVIQIDGGMNT